VTRDCVFNELCWFKPGERLPLDHQLLLDLVDIVRSVGCGSNGFRLPQDVLDYPIDEGITLRTWSYQALQSVRDREIRRFLTGMLSSTYSHFGGYECATCDGQEAKGLYEAYREHQLAVSLLSEKRWDTDTLSILIKEVPSSKGFAKHSVRHATRLSHLENHISWLSRDFTPREYLKLLLCCSEPPVHTPASSYCRGKHVCGHTNEVRKDRAALPGGAGQFRALLDDGTRVTDAIIEEWEKRALDAVGGSMEILVERHSYSTLYILLDLDRTVGYSGGTGKPTSRMRVEISQRTVHSHPF
jgi:hypothetical protein